MIVFVAPHVHCNFHIPNGNLISYAPLPFLGCRNPGPGNRCKFQCHSGYSHSATHSYLMCQVDGTWDLDVNTLCTGIYI
jgi:hypothetical protein